MSGSQTSNVHTLLSSKEHVRSVFSGRVAEWASCYSAPEARSLSAQSLISRQRFALEMIEGAVPRGSRILDVGCGTGEMAARLMHRGYEVWGLDIAEPMVRYARERCGSDRFRVGDIERLPFADDTFDAVVCLGVIEYLDGDERALREMWRVLKPGGSAVVSTPSAICPLYYMVRALVGMVGVTRFVHHVVKHGQRDTRLPMRTAAPDVHQRRYYRRKWLRVLRSVGLEPAAWICHGWGWPSRWLGPLAQRLPSQAGLFRDFAERLFRLTHVSRALEASARTRAINWLLAEQLVRVQAVK